MEVYTMPDDNVVSWILLTILVYGTVLYTLAKGFLDKEKYERENNDLF